MAYGRRFQEFLCSFGSLRKAAKAMKDRGVPVCYETIRNWNNGKNTPTDVEKLKILKAFPEANLRIEDFFERYPLAHELWGGKKRNDA